MSIDFFGDCIYTNYYYIILQLKQSLNLQNNRDILEKMELPEPWRTNPLTYPTFSNLTVKAAGYGATSTSMNPDKTGKPVFKALHAGSLHVADAMVIDSKVCKSTWRNLNDAHQVCVSVTEDPQKKKVQGICNVSLIFFFFVITPTFT